ncbi:hypothetical protein HAHE_22580 [Haloferula helveola]|uniref:Uncharacterized protein n=1 Tax=Haloferula helveola TaxID=490095 RepID=A0ABM7RE48_9BACT|nr:hypothetical protein HAHE_22580 [Haloferula helveola]
MFIDLILLLLTVAVLLLPLIGLVCSRWIWIRVICTLALLGEAFVGGYGLAHFFGMGNWSGGRELHPVAYGIVAAFFATCALLPAILRPGQEKRSAGHEEF